MTRLTKLPPQGVYNADQTDQTCKPLPDNLAELLGRQRRLTNNLESNELTREISADLGWHETAVAVMLEGNRWGEQRYSLNNNYYSPASYQGNLSRCKTVKAAVKLLEREGLIRNTQMAAGLESIGFQSYFTPLPALHEFVLELIGNELPPIPGPRQLLVMRDAAGNLVKIKNSRDIQLLRKPLIEYGEAVESIEAGGTEIVRPFRAFKGGWKEGGRLCGMPHQWQSKVLRNDIMMDGEPTVELDFKAMQASLMYGEVGLPVPADSYDLAGFERPAVKKALLILTNAKNERSSRMAIACELYSRMLEARKLPPRKISDKVPGCWFIEADRLIEAIKARHKPIAHLFHAGHGLRLQYIESQIAMRVLALMLRKGIVALPIHDSFIIQTRHADTLEQAMIQAGLEVGKTALNVTYPSRS